ncbi:MAG: cytochrome c biogenesis protein ResB [Syntrophomonadaceae bacterium]|nr:cytochrome c biogenesis protein ResB [Syntrophomonadaceae bacterium]
MASVEKIYRLISSMKTGLVLLGLIGLMSAIGTGFRPNTFFQTSLFKLMLLLLFLNMGLCTLNQLIRCMKRSSKSWGKNRLRQAGLLLLHGGVVLILVGGTVNSYFGHSGELRIVEGNKVDVARVIPTEKPVLLRLDAFKIEFNADGSPSQYYSHVSILEGNKAKGNYRISVNHPLNYGGIKAYQQSFGYLVKVRGESATGEKVEKSLHEGEFLEIPGTERTVKVYKYIPNFAPNYGMDSKTLRPDNPRIVFSVYENGKLLGVGAAPWGKRIKIDNRIYVTFKGVQPFTVLKVKSDPGLPLAAAGGVMLVTGVCLAQCLAPVGKRGKQSASSERKLEPVGGIMDGLQ